MPLPYFHLKMRPPHLGYHTPHPPTLGCCVSNITEQPVMVGGTVEVVTSASTTIGYPYNLSPDVTSLTPATVLFADDLPPCVFCVHIVFHDVTRFELTVNVFDQCVYAVKSNCVLPLKLLPPEYPFIRLWF
jgi:hypothetical protein